MFYRVRADLAFTEEDEAVDFYHDCMLALLKSQTINPGQDNEEKGHIILEDCFHDEHPTIPCNIVNEDYTT